VYWDDSFQQKFGSNSLNTVNRILTAAQTFYYKSDTLTTKIELEVAKKQHLAGTAGFEGTISGL
jgi:hypothetical protein